MHPVRKPRPSSVLGISRNLRTNLLRHGFTAMWNLTFICSPFACVHRAVACEEACSLVNQTRLEIITSKMQGIIWGEPERS